MVATPLTGQYHNAVGRRKTAIARVRLYPGTGEMVVNGKEVHDYFGGRELHQITIGTPLRITNTADRFLVSVKVVGGGVSGQAGAIRHGIARALCRFDPELRGTLKRAGLLTRDARVRNVRRSDSSEPARRLSTRSANTPAMMSAALVEGGTFSWRMAL